VWDDVKTFSADRVKYELVDEDCVQTVVVFVASTVEFD